MSWVKVKQGNVELLIPHQAFKDVYEKNGFVLVEQPTHNSSSNTEKKLENNVGIQPQGVDNGRRNKGTRAGGNSNGQQRTDKVEC